MREYQNVALDLIDESTTDPRRVCPEDKLQELAASMRDDGVIQAIVLSRVGDRFILRAGGRRLRAARIAGLATIPALIRDMDETKAERIALIENIQRSDLEPLDEAYAFRQFMDRGRSLDELAATVQKPKRYVHEQLRLLNLTPEAQDLLSQDVLPIEYARLLARAPKERQADGLAQCYRPLFRDEGRRRDQLEPLATLRSWIEKTVRLDPRSDDTQITLPELAEDFKKIDAKKGASILMLSTLYRHVPDDPNGPSREKPILQGSWIAVEGKNICKHALPGLIVLGPGQGQQPTVCIEKKRCTKHWGRSTNGTAGSSDEPQRIDTARRAQEEAESARQEAARRWTEELCPRAMQLIAVRAAKLRWTPVLLSQIVDRDALGDLLPPLDKLPLARYPQAVVLALAHRASWRRETLISLLKTLRIRLAPKEIDGTPAAAPSAKHGDQKVSASPRKKARR